MSGASGHPCSLLSAFSLLPSFIVLLAMASSSADHPDVVTQVFPVKSSLRKWLFSNAGRKVSRTRKGTETGQKVPAVEAPSQNPTSSSSEYSFTRD